MELPIAWLRLEAEVNQRTLFGPPRRRKAEILSADEGDLP